MLSVLIIITLLCLLLLGVQLFSILGIISILLIGFMADVPVYSAIKAIFDSVNKPALLSIPLYVFAGAVMSNGQIARQLILFAQASVGWFKGGLGVASVLACMIFASISGSSPVTLIAIGTIMYPALIEQKYSENTALGVLTVSGSLGILIPPSIPMIVFSIVTGTDVNQLFLAGVFPGILTGFLLVVGVLIQTYRQPINTISFNPNLFLKQTLMSIPALLMPILVLGGIYSGIYNVTQAAAIAAVYAILIELFWYRKMKISELIDTLKESVVIMGVIFIILAMATMFNYFLIIKDVPTLLIEGIQNFVTSKPMFLICTIIMLLVIGLFMDAVSAILITAPLLLPSALHYDVNIVHLGIIFIMALEVGYLTPPVGINLFVATGLFNKNLTQVIRASLPYMMLLLLALLVVTFIPDILPQLFFN